MYANIEEDSRIEKAKHGRCSKSEKQFSCIISNKKKTNVQCDCYFQIPW